MRTILCDSARASGLKQLEGRSDDRADRREFAISKLPGMLFGFIHRHLQTP
jgi:hypothetical protein